MVLMRPLEAGQYFGIILNILGMLEASSDWTVAYHLDNKNPTKDVPYPLYMINCLFFL